jgi:hypothetical protein
MLSLPILIYVHYFLVFSSKKIKYNVEKDGKEGNINKKIFTREKIVSSRNMSLLLNCQEQRYSFYNELCSCFEYTTFHIFYRIFAMLLHLFVVIVVVHYVARKKDDKTDTKFSC